MIDRGKLDRKIVIEEPTDAKNTQGEDVITWSTFHTAFASLLKFTGNEREQASKETSLRKTKFLITFFAGINEEMRIVYGGNNYDILLIEEYGRDGLIITAEMTR